MKKALFWKLLERFGVQGTQFVLQIILARLLSPEHYGELSIMIIFTNLANVFIQRGFNTALIQNKDVTDDDYSSVFWVSMGIAVVLYIGMFFGAPIIADFYNMPNIVEPFRVISLMLLPGTMNSIQFAKVSREMDFKKVFYSSLTGILISGILGVVLAYMGAGLWALVAQSIGNVAVSCLVMLFTVKWYPRVICNWNRVKVLFSYGYKLLLSGLLDVLFSNINSLIVGKKYNADTLGFYNRGQQFPQVITNSINDAVQSVLLPAMSAQQDDKQQVKTLMRNSVMLGSYIIFPMMAGLAAVASPLIMLLLTDKWLPAVPYMQICCFTFAFIPVHTCNLQAINAVGRSDIFLKLEIVKKAVGIVVLCIGVFCFDSPIAIAMTGVVNTVISCFINAYPNKKLINYSYVDQMRDIFPSFSLAIVMCIIVLSLTVFSLNPIVLLMIQIVVGVAVYFGLSAIFKVTPFQVLMGMAKEMLKKRMIK